MKSLILTAIIRMLTINRTSFIHFEVKKLVYSLYTLKYSIKLSKFFLNHFLYLINSCESLVSVRIEILILLFSRIRKRKVRFYSKGIGLSI